MHQSKTIITALIALLVLLGGVYVWQKRQAEKVPPVPRENPTPDTPLTQQDLSTRYPQHIVPIEGTDEVRYQIPELGIQMRMNRQFGEDLVYVYTKSDEKITKDEQKHVGPFHERASFSSRSLMTQEPACTPDSRAIGEIIKESGSDKDWAGGNYYDEHVQFSHFFLSFGIPLNQDNPKTPICSMADGSKWASSQISNEMESIIEKNIDVQSGYLYRAFKTVQEL